MQLHCYLIEALDHVLSWDVSADGAPNALVSQAALLAALDAEAVDEPDWD